jgi:hypothetical protein
MLGNARSEMVTDEAKAASSSMREAEQGFQGAAHNSYIEVPSLDKTGRAKTETIPTVNATSR